MWRMRGGVVVDRVTMRPGDVLQALVAGKPARGNRAFGGYCIACDRAMSKQRFFKDERLPSWVVRANSYRCYQCYRKWVRCEEDGAG